MDTFRAHHADILDPAQQPRAIALLPEHGLVTFTGITSAEIAADLVISDATVKSHIGDLLAN
jgi:DNA-binding NarL/FixJ family response regulator